MESSKKVIKKQQQQQQQQQRPGGNSSGRSNDLKVKKLHGKSESRARTFYKKPSSGGVGKTSASPSGKKTMGAFKRSSSKKSIMDKRAKVKFYQSQNHANASWYTLKDTIKAHLEYAIQKYPVDEELEYITSIHHNVMKTFNPTQIEMKLHASLEEKRLSEGRGASKIKVQVKPQFSSVALDKIWLFCANRAEKLLIKAAENTTTRKQQTTTVDDLLLAYRDLKESGAPPTYL